ncbi:MAG TPA: tRNA preQ1(34) S-adenosylmethionine ribosyltransferase-isomerase QueA [Spirochaetota bacterium]|nr:tRNA preQ1(34) S-adenosylmethionine ribosyltransferase-isomerase QueA [Spirochaetota bacterium]
MSRVYKLSDFNYEIADEQIAQYPLEKRENSKLFVIHRDSSFQHALFYELPGLLDNGDILVVNNAKVIPARIFFVRETGGVVEIILTQKKNETRWLVLSNRTGRLKVGETLKAVSDNSVAITIINRVQDYLEIETHIEFSDPVLSKIGHIPLPPYIKREVTENDACRYQTVYAREGTAAAAPTAGLHFTEELLQTLCHRGVDTVPVTLNVSWGTFQPVRTENLQNHTMHSEEYYLSEESAETINLARGAGKRIVAVGTTSVRVLESTFHNGKNVAGRGETNIFIYPPYKINSIDALITNFHTPLSTLLMLVAAFGGYETVMNAYREAVDQEYRFFSYGDAMLLFR